MKLAFNVTRRAEAGTGVGNPRPLIPDYTSLPKSVKKLENGGRLGPPRQDLPPPPKKKNAPLDPPLLHRSGGITVSEPLGGSVPRGAVARPLDPPMDTNSCVSSFAASPRGGSSPPTCTRAASPTSVSRCHATRPSGSAVSCFHTALLAAIETHQVLLLAVAMGNLT